MKLRVLLSSVVVLALASSALASASQAKEYLHGLVLRAVVQSPVFKASGLKLANPNDPEFKEGLASLDRLHRKEARELLMLFPVAAPVLLPGMAIVGSAQALDRNLPRLGGTVKGRIELYVRLPDTYEGKAYARLNCTYRFKTERKSRVRQLTVKDCTTNPSVNMEHFKDRHDFGGDRYDYTFHWNEKVSVDQCEQGANWVCPVKFADATTFFGDRKQSLLVNTVLQ